MDDERNRMIEDQEFRAWMKKVDAHISRKLGGLTSDDLPDCCYRDWFNDGTSPSKAAKMAMSDE
jgi:hypothetical protein